jgi:hypothetical protein
MANAALSGQVGKADVQRAVKERLSYEVARKMSIYPPDHVTKAFSVIVYVPETKVRWRRKLTTRIS